MSEVMKPDPIAWVYQNANTEHQYLVWHKQEGGRNWTPLFTLQDVQDAILAEREKVAQWMMAQGYSTGHGDTVEHLLKELEWQIEERIKNEREACAKLCDVLAVHPEYASDITKVAAQAIRARGEKLT